MATPPTPSVTATQLASVRALIAQLEKTGASDVEHADHAIRYQRLQDLYKREQTLIDRLAIEQAQDGASVAPIRVRGGRPV